MAASLADCDESVLFQNPTDLRSRKNSKSTQPGPQPESRKSRCGSAWRLRTGRQFSKNKRKRLDEVSSRLFDGRALARDVELRAQRHKNVVLTLDNRSEERRVGKEGTNR